jgi:hypothetical protein
MNNPTHYRMIYGDGSEGMWWPINGHFNEEEAIQHFEEALNSDYQRDSFWEFEVRGSYD